MRRQILVVLLCKVSFLTLLYTRTVALALDAPTVEVAFTAAGIGIVWQHSGLDAINFEIYRGDPPSSQQSASLVFTSPRPNGGWNDSVLEGVTKYNYIVCAYNPYTSKRNCSGWKTATTTPLLLAPVNGQVFLPESQIPIRLAPPSGWSVTGYVVNVQRKDATGNYVTHNVFPVPATQAESAQGFLGFGNGGTGATKYPTLLTTAGQWRLNAKVGAPKESAWSDWLLFTVRAPLLSNPAALRK